MAVARMKAREDQEAAGQLIRRTAVERAMTDATAIILNAGVNRCQWSSSCALSSSVDSSTAWSRVRR
jgi:hypothetical protein